MLILTFACKFLLVHLSFDEALGSRKTGLALFCGCGVFRGRNFRAGGEFDMLFRNGRIFQWPSEQAVV